MKRRRRRGSGAIEVTRDGLFRARFSFTRGNREDIDGSPFLTREAAERALDALNDQVRSGAVSSLKARCSGVYFLRAGDGPIKIGYGDSIEKRVAAAQTYHWEPVRLLAFVRGATKLDEMRLHRQFAAARIRGEWFWPVAELVAHVGALNAKESQRRTA